jgi:hypothetical protein
MLHMPGTRLVGTAFAVVGFGIGALVPIFLIAYPAAGLGQADAGNPAAILPVVVANPALFAGPGILEIVVHAVGAIAVFGLWARFGGTSFLLAIATLGGLAWMILDVADSAIAFHVVPLIAANHVAGDATAATAFTQLESVVDAVRLAGHFLGGLWMVGVSVFAIQTGRLPRIIGWLGVVVGLVFTGNLFVPALLNVSFMTVPAWLVILGIGVARSEGATEASLLPQMGQA